MRILMSGLLCAGLFGPQLAAAAEQCVRPADHAAFDMQGLKSELMVTALSCGVQPKYNAFINRFHSDLGVQEKALNTYFLRSYGRSGQKAHDDYVTQLANEQSSDGLKAGTAFCARNVGMFDEVQALHGASEMSSYVAGKDIIQPVSLQDCGAVQPAGRAGVHQVKATRTVASHHKK